MKGKSIIFLIIIIGWCGVIFLFSNQISSKSNEKSREIISFVTLKSVSVSNYLHITHIDLNDKVWLSQTVTRWNRSFRKFCHAFVYFILCIFLLFFFDSYGFSLSKSMYYAIVLCFLYSITDEFHQLFILGRTGQFLDCLIDTFGACCGGVFFPFLKRLVSFKNV